MQTATNVYKGTVGYTAAALLLCSLAKIKLSTEIRGGPYCIETHGALNGNRIELLYCSLTIPVPVLSRKLSFS